MSIKARQLLQHLSQEVNSDRNFFSIFRNDFRNYNLATIFGVIQLILTRMHCHFFRKRSRMNSWLDADFSERYTAVS